MTGPYSSSDDRRRGGPLRRAAQGFSLAAQGLSLAAALGLCGCSAGSAVPAAPHAAPISTPPVANAAAAKPAGASILDSFGNVDFYTPTADDTYAGLAAAFGLSEAKIEDFNGLQAGLPLRPGVRLRLIPPGPLPGARGPVTVDSHGVPLEYTVAAEDTIGGIAYRFGLTGEQLAEANKVPYVYEKGNVYFIHPGDHIQLQKSAVPEGAGKGTTTENSFGRADFYTTVDGDSLDSLGYRFRSTSKQLLLYNPLLSAAKPIAAGTVVQLMPGNETIEGATGTFTADARGIPQTYTTAPGDTERQVAFRFNLDVAELGEANRPLQPGGGVWYDFADLPGGVLTPGQTISLTRDRPINK